MKFAPLTFAKKHPGLIAGAGAGLIVLFIVTRPRGDAQSVVQASGPSDATVQAQAQYAGSVLAYNAHVLDTQAAAATEQTATLANRDIELAKIDAQNFETQTAGNVALYTQGSNIALALRQSDNETAVALRQSDNDLAALRDTNAARVSISSIEANRDVTIADKAAYTATYTADRQLDAIVNTNLANILTANAARKASQSVSIGVSTPGGFGFGVKI